jgi:3-oxoadipate enol-lactonase
MIVHHRIDGPSDAPVLVLSHALGTSLELWDANLPYWNPRFRVLRYDVRGHGRSPIPDSGTALDDLGRDVLELLDRLELDKVSFCGISLGGATGLWLAANAPDRVERLVVACSSATFGGPDQWLERAATVRAQGTASIADAVVGRWFTPAFAAAKPGIVRAYREMLVRTPAEGYAASCEAVAAWDFRDELRTVAVETLVVAGADDSATPVDHSKEIAGGVGSSRIEVLEHAAHLANAERPEAFGELVASYVGETQEVT